MKNQIVLLTCICLLLLSAIPSIAQTASSDVLYRIDLGTVNVKIREITATEVFYSEHNTPTIPHKIAKTELLKVVFSDGSSDVYNTPKPLAEAKPDGKKVALNQQQPASVVVSQERKQNSSVTSVVSQPVESSDSPQSIIKYAPLTSIGYERVLANNRSLYAGLSLYTVNAYLTRVTAIGLKGEYRFYGLVKSSPKKAPEGFWVAPTVLLWNVTVSDLDFSESVFVAQLGDIAGYQGYLTNKFHSNPPWD